MPNEFDNTDPLQLSTEPTNPPTEPLVEPLQSEEPVQEEVQPIIPSEPDEMDGYINTLYELGHGHQRVADMAAMKGYDRDEVISRVQSNATTERENYEAKYQEDLANLRAHKQELSNNAERLRRLSDEGSDEARNAYLTAGDITASDTEYQEAYQNLNQLEGWLAVLNSPNSTNGEIEKVERQIYENTGEYFQDSPMDQEIQRLDTSADRDDDSK